MKTIRMLHFFFLFYASALPFTAAADTYHGFKENPAAGLMTLNEKVDRLIDTDQGVLIQVSNHAGLYLFPKKDSFEAVKKILEKSQRDKSKLTFKINAYSQQVSSITQ